MNLPNILCESSEGNAAVVLGTCPFLFIIFGVAGCCFTSDQQRCKSLGFSSDLTLPHESCVDARRAHHYPRSFYISVPLGEAGGEDASVSCTKETKGVKMGGVMG